MAVARRCHDLASADLLELDRAKMALAAALEGGESKLLAADQPAKKAAAGSDP